MISIQSKGLSGKPGADGIQPPPTPPDTNPPHPLAFFFCCAARYIFKDMMPVCNYYDRELGGGGRNDTAAHFFPPHKITVGNPSVSKLTRPSLKKMGEGMGRGGG